jgi:hypothetical protein
MPHYLYCFEAKLEWQRCSYSNIGYHGRKVKMGLIPAPLILNYQLNT